MKKTVVYCTDGEDTQYLNASIFSVRKFLGNDTDIVVLTETLDLPVSGARVINIGKYVDEIGFFPNRWSRQWPYATLFRMFIPLIPELADLDRVLYLDTDTLVLSDSALELFRIDTKGHEVIACPDSNGNAARVDTCLRNDLCQRGMISVLLKLWTNRDIADYKYVNAGVALWCPAKINSNGTEWYKQRLRWFWEAETRGRFKFLDQDFINSMMDTDCLLDRIYNNFADTDCSNAVIKHYILGTKNSMLQEAEEILGYSKEVMGHFPIVYSSDGNDSDRLKMSMYSARKYLGESVKFYILTELESYPGLDENVTLINPVKTLKNIGFYSDGWDRKWPFSCLFRLSVPLLDELAAEDRIVYLDTDILIRNSDARNLFKLGSYGFEVCGVSDIEARQWDIENMMKYDISGEAYAELYERLWKPRVSVSRAYINSGVLVMFLSQIRENGLDWYKKRLKWLWSSIERRGFGFPDQGFINLMMDVNPSLSVRYNRFAGDNSTNCILQHFVGHTKGTMISVAASMGYKKTGI